MSINNVDPNLIKYQQGQTGTTETPIAEEENTGVVAPDVQDAVPANEVEGTTAVSDVAQTGTTGETEGLFDGETAAAAEPSPMTAQDAKNFINGITTVTSSSGPIPRAYTDTSLPAKMIDTTNSVGYNVSSLEETQASIEADLAVLAEYDKLYNDIVDAQVSLENEAASFTYPDPSKIKSSSQAKEALNKIDAQIQTIQTLIKAAETAIKTLETQKKTAESQKALREAEAEQTENEIAALEAQMEANEQQAEQELQKYQEDSEKRIEQFTQEYHEQGLAQQGVDMEDYIASQMAAYPMPNSISQLSETNKSLASQIDVKKSQLNVINQAIAGLETKIKDIDTRLETQNDKLEGYNKTLEQTQTTRSQYQKLYEAYKKKEKAKHKPWRGFSRVLNNVFKNINALFKNWNDFGWDTGEDQGAAGYYTQSKKGASYVFDWANATPAEKAEFQAQVVLDGYEVGEDGEVIVPTDGYGIAYAMDNVKTDIEAQQITATTTQNAVTSGAYNKITFTPQQLEMSYSELYTMKEAKATGEVDSYLERLGVDMTDELKATFKQQIMQLFKADFNAAYEQHVGTLPEGATAGTEGSVSEVGDAEIPANNQAEENEETSMTPDVTTDNDMLPSEAAPSVEDPIILEEEPPKV